MELTQLYYFYKAAELEHITKASREINIAQPALTKAIHKLEEELEVPLFLHNGRNIKLTPWGKWLYEKLKDPLGSILNIKNEINLLKNNKHIKICALAASTFVTNAILQFKRKYNNITFTLLQNECDDWDILVDSGEKGYMEEIFIGCGSLYKNKIKEVTDLKDKPVITFTHFKELRDNIDRFYKDNNIKPNIAFECDNLNILHDLILENNGIGFIPEFTSGDIFNDISLLRLDNYKINRYICITKNQFGLNNGKIVDEFYEYLNSCFKNNKILSV